MPASEDPKQKESIKDQPGVPDLEIATEELEQEDADEVSGGHPIGMYMSG